MLALIADVAPTIPVPPELLGPAALTVGALIVVGVLWREHLRADAEDRKQRDDQLAINEKLRDTISQLSGALEQDSERRRDRRRASDS